jgi:hypothetical protein
LNLWLSQEPANIAIPEIDEAQGEKTAEGANALTGGGIVIERANTALCLVA